MTAVIDNASMLLGVPHWLRNAAAAPPLWLLQMARVGLDELPASPPSRITRFTGARSVLAAGVPGLTTPPDRMRVDIPGWPGAGTRARAPEPPGAAHLQVMDVTSTAHPGGELL
jgi:hypothetical protein